MPAFVGLKNIDCLWWRFRDWRQTFPRFSAWGGANNYAFLLCAWDLCYETQYMHKCISIIMYTITKFCLPSFLLFQPSLKLDIFFYFVPSLETNQFQFSSFLANSWRQLNLCSGARSKRHSFLPSLQVDIPAVAWFELSHIHEGIRLATNDWNLFLLDKQDTLAKTVSFSNKRCK